MMPYSADLWGTASDSGGTYALWSSGRAFVLRAVVRHAGAVPDGDTGSVVSCAARHDERQGRGQSAIGRGDFVGGETPVGVGPDTCRVGGALHRFASQNRLEGAVLSGASRTVPVSIGGRRGVAGRSLCISGCVCCPRTFRIRAVVPRRGHSDLDSIL